MVLVLGVFPVIGYYFYHGWTSLERFFAFQMIAGNVPYYNFSFEYPPLTLLAFLLPGLVFREPLAYGLAFSFEMFVYDLLIMYFIMSISRLYDFSIKKALIIYSVVVITVGPILVVRYDIFPAMLTMAGLYAFIKKRPNLAWGAVTLGVMAKLYPMVLLPLFAIYHIVNKQYTTLLRGALVFIIVITAISLPWLILDAPAYGESFSYHFERGLHSESSYGSLLLVGKLLGWTTSYEELSYGSWNIVSTLADNIADISSYIVFVVLLIIYVGFAWRLWKEKSTTSLTSSLRPNEAFLLGQFAFLAVLGFLLFNKVFSAQYIVWLIPLAIFIPSRYNYISLLLVCLASLLTQFVFPYTYIEFAANNPPQVVLMVIRNIIFFIVFIFTFISSPDDSRHMTETASTGNSS